MKPTELILQAIKESDLTRQLKHRNIGTIQQSAKIAG
jgi:hypothetical protein